MNRLESRLEAAFGQAEPEHFVWQTQHPVVAAHERVLVERAFLPLGSRVLDVGCAEGATLRHLGDPKGAVGVDLFEAKLAFARSTIERATFIRGSVYALPFADGEFDHVIVRDVVHHLDHPARAIAEISRVLSANGRLDVLEPCGKNPLIFAHALLRPAERGELRSDGRFLEALLAPHFAQLAVARFQPLPLHRLLFHPKLGARWLDRSALATSLAEALEQGLGRFLPRAMWAYVRVRGVKR